MEWNLLYGTAEKLKTQDFASFLQIFGMLNYLPFAMRVLHSKITKIAYGFDLKKLSNSIKLKMCDCHSK